MRIGKLNQTFLNTENSKNPYSTHENIEVGSKLVRSLNFLSNRMRKLAERCEYLPVEGETLAFDMKNLYLNQTVSRFNWYLNVLEFTALDGTRFKYCGMVDLDITAAHSLEEVYDQVILELEHQRRNLGKSCVAWFTGKKGFRIGFIPEFDEKLEERKSPHEYMLSPLGGVRFYIKESARPKLQSELLSGIVDNSIYIPGHGVKFDLMHHPDTKRLPVFLSGDKESDMAKVLGNYPTSTNELAMIADFWIELFTVIEMILSAPLPVYLPEDYSTKAIEPLTPRSMNVVGDSIVDPLVRIEPISEREAKMRIVKEFVGDGLGHDPYHVIVSRFLSETKNPENLYVVNLSSRIKVLSEKVLIITFSVGSTQQLVCPLHNRKHKKNGKIYIVYVKATLYFSIRCHSSVTDTKEVRVPLFADQSRLTGFSSRTIEIVSPFTTTISAPFIGDMLVKDARFKDKDIILLRSAMGSGKTVAISSLIKDMEERLGGTLRVLVISTRRTCMMMLSDMFDVGKYLNTSDGSIRADIHQMDKIVVSMESLHRLIPRGSVNIIKKFDLVILDECESILANFSSVTMKNRRKNYQLIKAIMETEGTKTVFSDAFLGECTLQFFMMSGLLSSKSWSLIVNTHNKSSTKYELFTDQMSGLFIADYKHAIMTHQRFIFASDRIDAISYFQDLLVTFLPENELKKKKILTITAGSAPDVILSASDCKSWEDYDYIYYSPAVTVGNSYAPVDSEKRFHLLFGLFTGTTTTLDAIQMTGRARSLKRSVAKILLSQTSVLNGERFVEDKKEVSRYIEERIKNASDELGVILRADRNRNLTRLMAEQIPGSQIVTDLSSSADDILVVPKETNIEEMTIDMPVSYLESIFVLNVINERRSKFTQLEHWSLYLSTTYLSFRIITQREEKKKKSLPILSVIASKKKQYEERRRLAGDQYSNEDILPTGEELKKLKEEDRVISDITVDEVNVKKIQSILGEHISPALGSVLNKIRSGNVGTIKDLPINWEKIQQFLSAHVNVDCLERFYFLFRNIERPIAAIRHSELTGTMFRNTSEFIGRGSLVLSHIKPIYDAVVKDLLKASFQLRSNTSKDDIPEWISADRSHDFMYFDITAFFCMNTDLAYTILCNFLNDKNAISEESVYFRTNPIKAFANKNQLTVIEKILSKFPELSFTSGMGEFQKLGFKSKSCSLLSVSISIFVFVLTKYFQSLFGAIFQKVSWEEQKRLGFSDSRRRYQGIRSTRVRFRDDVFENSKSLALLCFEDKMEFSPTYPFFDMIV